MWCFISCRSRMVVEGFVNVLCNKRMKHVVEYQDSCLNAKAVILAVDLLTDLFEEIKRI